MATYQAVRQILIIPGEEQSFTQLGQDWIFGARGSFYTFKMNIFVPVFLHYVSSWTHPSA